MHVKSLSMLAQCKCPHANLHSVSNREGGVPGHPALAAQVTGLPTSLRDLDVRCHCPLVGIVLSFGQNPPGLAGHLQNVLAASGLLPSVFLKLPLDSS